MNQQYKQHEEIYQRGYRFDPELEVFYVAHDIIENFKHPEGYEDWNVQQEVQESFYNERITQELQLNEEDNQVLLYGGPNCHENERTQNKIFTTNSFGDIEILCYTLHRKPFLYAPQGAQRNSATNVAKYDVITRYCPWREKLMGRKYNITGKTGIHPFFHPILIEKFEQKEEIQTLVITEGYIKAFKACMEGLMTVGLSSISHYRDKETGEIHPEIIDLIKACRVQNVVILWDGDCLNISRNAVLEEDDLYKRPAGFFAAAKKMQGSLKEFISKKTKIWFARIASDRLNNQPKGIDDLFIEFKGNESDIVRDFENIGSRPGSYIDRFEITTSLKRLARYFKIDKPESFYHFHSDLLGECEFIFNGTKYRYNPDGNVLEVKVPASAKEYFRIGVKYYREIQSPDKHQNLIDSLEIWSKEAIVQDHGKDFLKHITKLNRFVNVPMHDDYQKIIHNCYNKYYEMKNEPKPGEWPTIRQLLKHIFEDQYEFGLDYIQLLYTKPQEPLPIFCLVSKEQQTGKSTFINFLKYIFESNMAIIGNAELSSEFNSGWVTKLLIASEETFLEKKTVMEKIKALSTAEKVAMRAMHSDLVEMDFFGKFVFASNNEDNFIQVDHSDTRYWIRKIKSIADENRDPLMNQKLKEEVPGFLHFLLNRKLHVPKKMGRMWFNTEDLKTEAFFKVARNSTSTIEKEIRSRLKEMFKDFDREEILMTTKDIKQQFGLNRYENNYINRVIKEMGVDRFERDGKEVVCAYSFPTWDIDSLDGEESIYEVKGKGRPFVFQSSLFLDPEETEVLNELLMPEKRKNEILQISESVQDELPFIR